MSAQKKSRRSLNFTPTKDSGENESPLPRLKELKIRLYRSPLKEMQWTTSREERETSPEVPPTEPKMFKYKTPQKRRAESPAATPSKRARSSVSKSRDNTPSRGTPKSESKHHTPSRSTPKSDAGSASKKRTPQAKIKKNEILSILDEESDSDDDDDIDEASDDDAEGTSSKTKKGSVTSKSVPKVVQPARAQRTPLKTPVTTPKKTPVSRRKKTPEKSSRENTPRRGRSQNNTPKRETEKNYKKTPLKTPSKDTPKKEHPAIAKIKSQTNTPRKSPVKNSPKAKKVVVEEDSWEEDESSASEESESSVSEEETSEDDFTQKVTKKNGKKGRPAKKPITKKQMVARVPSRHIPLPKCRSPLHEAQQRLHVSAVPDSLPCREEEFAEIYNFTEGNIQTGSGGCMYISGVPGTGKTATVKEVIRILTESSKEGDLPEFKFIEINGMRLTEPTQAYVQIWKGLEGKKATPEHASKLLDSRFGNQPKKSPVVVLLVDELDMLWNRKQSVLYNIFEWPTRANSRLIVLAIANTMDLPERIMMNKVSSRLGLSRLTFLPYTHQQLQEIVASRLVGLSLFDADAVQLVARKVASLSGDARRALDICRRATEIAEQKSSKLVGLEHVTLAHQEMFMSPKITAIRTCSKMEQLFLQAVVTRFRQSGIEEATFGRVFDEHTQILQFEGLDRLNLDQAYAVCNRLSACRLIMAEHGRCGLQMRIRLNVAPEDVTFALQS